MSLGIANSVIAYEAGVRRDPGAVQIGEVLAAGLTP